MTRSSIQLCWAIVVLVIVAFVEPLAIEADVPRAEDVVECNAEAHDAVQPGSAARDRSVPTASDQRRAAQRRHSEASPMVRSQDAQLHGMDGEGAKDPAYQAVFRGCMRRRGF